jgi:hypothetical protein
MLSEFKAFIARGNVLDLAVAVIIGAAFATIVGSLTDDIIMPAIGAIFGGVDFSSHFILLSVPEGYTGSMADYAALKEAGAAMIGYGAFPPRPRGESPDRQEEGRGRRPERGRASHRDQGRTAQAALTALTSH